jgi:hypothetical protein
MLGLKVKKRWLERIRKAKRPFLTPKTVEVRKYLPSRFTPKGQDDLEPGDRFYLLCDGEIWASATLDGFHLYRSLEAFARDVENHQVCRETTPATGPTAYSHLAAAFSQARTRDGGGGESDKITVFGWCLGELRFFEERPRAGQPYGAARTPIPDFKGQRFGQVLFNGTLPVLDGEE